MRSAQPHAANAPNSLCAPPLALLICRTLHARRLFRNSRLAQAPKEVCWHPCCRQLILPRCCFQRAAAARPAAIGAVAAAGAPAADSARLASAQAAAAFPCCRCRLLLQSSFSTCFWVPK